MVKPTEDDPKKPERQNTHIRALKHHSKNLNVFYGRFAQQVARAPLLYRQDGSPARKSDYLNHLNIGRSVTILKTEEKKTDVNIAVHLLNDAWLNNYECAVLVSNDSGLG